MQGKQDGLFISENPGPEHSSADVKRIKTGERKLTQGGGADKAAFRCEEMAQAVIKDQNHSFREERKAEFGHTAFQRFAEDDQSWQPEQSHAPLSPFA